MKDKMAVVTELSMDLQIWNLIWSSLIMWQ